VLRIKASNDFLTPFSGKEKLDAELLTDTYQAGKKMAWDEFRQEYEAKVLAGKAIRTCDSAAI
jgi:hypothetical protein